MSAGLLLKKAIGLTQTEKDAREGYEFLYCLLIEPSVRIAERKAAKEASEKKGENEE